MASLVGIGTVIGRALRKKSKDNHAKVAEAQRYSAETINNQECFTNFAYSNCQYNYRDIYNIILFYFLTLNASCKN